MSKKVVVIGSGPAGMTAAYELAKLGVQVDVYEASDSIGGMSKSIKLWNQIVDIGPHRFFSNDTRVNKIWLEVVGRDYKMVNRLTRVYYKGKFFFYPVKLVNALKNLGIIEAAQSALSFFKEKVVPTKDKGTFESWVTQRFGKRLYQIFFKEYTEKLWGIKCTDLDSDFAAQRIKKLSLWEAFKGALFKDSSKKHKTLVDVFAYPVEGTGMVYLRMAEFVKSKGGNIYLKTPVDKIITENKTAKAIQLADGTVKECDVVISSMPLTLMVSRLPDVPQSIIDNCNKLKFRNTIIVYLHVNGVDLFPDNWLYINSDDVKTGRITNFRNWVPQLYGNEKTSILALEYWCYDEDAIWKEDNAKLVELAKKEIKVTGLTGNTEILDGHVYRIPRCYPVYSTGYKEELKPVEDYLKTLINLIPIGRYGAFKYNNQDHSILMGYLAAENIVKNTKHDLWEINTDYENYQEQSLITETGLEVAAAPH
ncbi:MAG TPA: FAD-dependent oxidoreductase [Bacteroidia bacterium]|nr:FAD-dependent oxidoreductase [Bacteroidia bacterium]